MDIIGNFQQITFKLSDNIINLMELFLAEVTKFDSLTCPCGSMSVEENRGSVY